MSEDNTKYCSESMKHSGFNSFREALDSGTPLEDRAAEIISSKILKVIPYAKYYYSPGYTPLVYDTYEKWNQRFANEVKDGMAEIVVDVEKLKRSNPNVFAKFSEQLRFSDEVRAMCLASESPQERAC